MNPTGQPHNSKPPLKRDQHDQFKEARDTAKPKTSASARKTSKESLAQYTADTMITGALKAKFMADSNVPFNAISVETNDGVVKLTGQLENQQQIVHVEKIAKSVKGVKTVNNQLELKGD